MGWECDNCGAMGILDGPYGLDACPQCHKPRAKLKDKPATDVVETTAKTSGGKVTAKGGKSGASDNE